MVGHCSEVDAVGDTVGDAVGDAVDDTVDDAAMLNSARSV